MDRLGLSLGSQARSLIKHQRPVGQAAMRDVKIGRSQ